MNHNHLLACIVALTACAPESGPGPQGPDQTRTAETLSIPPGFLDDAPPPPTSDTVILSGGTLITDATVPDSVVVIRNGVLRDWGQRGSVNVPNDSVGLNTSGQWIVPGTMEDLHAGSLPNLETWQADTPANLLILDRYPSTDADAVTGRYANGKHLTTHSD